MNVMEAHCHAEVGMRKINGLSDRNRLAFCVFRIRYSVSHPTFVDQHPVLRRILHLPSFAAVKTAGQYVVLRLITIDVVILFTQIFVEPCAESDQNLVSPNPHSMVGGPTSKLPFFAVNHDALLNPRCGDDDRCHGGGQDDRGSYNHQNAAKGAVGH